MHDEACTGDRLSYAGLVVVLATGVGALQGAGFARAEGFAVRDVAHDALGADVPHADDVLGQGTDAL